MKFDIVGSMVVCLSKEKGRNDMILAGLCEVACLHHQGTCLHNISTVILDTESIGMNYYRKNVPRERTRYRCLRCTLLVFKLVPNCAARRMFCPNAI